MSRRRRNLKPLSKEICGFFGKAKRGVLSEICNICPDGMECEAQRSNPTDKQPAKDARLNRRRSDMAESLLKRAQESSDKQDSKSTDLGKEVEGQTIYHKFVKIFQATIQEAEDKTVEPGTTFDEEYTQQRLFVARARAVKDANKATNKLLKFIQENYEAELKYSKENIYPREWMRRDKRIMQTLEHYPLLLDLLNYIFNLTRYIKGDEQKIMIALNDKVIGDKYSKNGKDREFSSFITDQEFYDKLMKKFGKKHSTIEKYLKALTDAEIIFKAGRVNVEIKMKGKEMVVKEKRGGTTLYVDGYFAPAPGNRLVKHPFLIESKSYKKALRTFNIKW